MTMMVAGYVTEAIWVLTQYDACARGQDMEQLRPADVVEAQGTVALLFGIATRGESAKTGSGQGVVLRRGAVAELLLAMRDYALRHRWRWACGRLGLGHAPPPDSLRHTGPSEDLARRRASLEGIRRRGRWRSMDSVQRYTKTFALTKFKARMPAWSFDEAIAGDLRRAVRDAMASPPARRHGAALRIRRRLGARAMADHWEERPAEVDPDATVSGDDGWDRE